MWRGTFLWCQAHPHCKWGGAPVLSNFGVPFYFCVHPLTANYQIWCVRGLFSGVSPIPVKAGSQRSPIFRVPLYIYAYTLWCRTTKFDALTHMGSGLVFRRSITVQPQTEELQRSPILRVLYLWLHSKGRGNTWGGACFSVVNHALHLKAAWP